MKKSNKFAVFISVLSVVVIGGSLYYYNDALSKRKSQIEQEMATTTTTEITTTTEAKYNISEKNINITTEVKDNKFLVIELENISGRKLSDIVLEADFKQQKITEIFIDSMEKDSKKKIEVPLDNKVTSLSIKNNETITNEFRLTETKEFRVGEDLGNIYVTSIKSQTKEFYKEKISASALEPSLKEEIIKKIDSTNDVSEIEQLFKENKLFPELKLSDDHVSFKPGESELKVESNFSADSTTQSSTASNSDSVINNNNSGNNIANNGVQTKDTEAPYGYIPSSNSSQTNSRGISNVATPSVSGNISNITTPGNASPSPSANGSTPVVSETLVTPAPAAPGSGSGSAVPSLQPTGE